MNYYQQGFPGYNQTFPGLKVSDGLNSINSVKFKFPESPQAKIDPQPGWNPYYYAQSPANQWAIPNPVTPVSNIRNIPQPPMKQFKNKTFPVTEPRPILRNPQQQNPFMNPPVTSFDTPQIYQDYEKYNTVSYPTPATEAVRDKVAQDFTKNLYQDPGGRLFDRQNSQRQFYSVPVGSVPNDQTEFAEFLYGKDLVCKSGSIWMRYGEKYTNDSLACTGFDAAEPTNFGLLK